MRLATFGEWRVVRIPLRAVFLSFYCLFSLVAGSSPIHGGLRDQEVTKVQKFWDLARWTPGWDEMDLLLQLLSSSCASENLMAGVLKPAGTGCQHFAVNLH